MYSFATPEWRTLTVSDFNNCNNKNIFQHLGNKLLSRTHSQQDSTNSIFMEVPGQLKKCDNNAVSSGNVCDR